MTDLNVTREMPSCDSELIGSFSVPIVLSVVYGAYAYGVAAWQGTHREAYSSYSDVSKKWLLACLVY